MMKLLILTEVFFQYGYQDMVVVDSGQILVFVFKDKIM